MTRLGHPEVTAGHDPTDKTPLPPASSPTPTVAEAEAVIALLVAGLRAGALAG